jgi:hypothetical protein
MVHDDKRKVRDHVRDGILHTLIEPSYFSDVNETLKGRKCWRISGHIFESMSKILLAVSGVLSFAAGVYDDKILSFTAGTLSTISLATFQFSLYSFKQHKKNTFELNQLLGTLEIQEVPELCASSPGMHNTEYGMMGRRVEENDYQKEFKVHEDNEKPIEIEMTKY